MIDIVSTTSDIGLFDAQTSKAGNLLSVQLGGLEYAQDFGIDLKYFLSSDFKFQNASFKSYLVDVLAKNGINISSVIDVMQNLYATYTFNINPEPTDTTLIAR